MKLVVHHYGPICLEHLYVYEANNNLVTFDSGCMLSFEYGKYCSGENPNGVNVGFFNYKYAESALSWLQSWSNDASSEGLVNVKKR